MPPLTQDLIALQADIERFAFDPAEIDPWRVVNKERYALTVVCEKCGCQYDSTHPAHHVAYYSFATLYRRSHTFPLCPVCRKIELSQSKETNDAE